jgi:hypothetical protein
MTRVTASTSDGRDMTILVGFARRNEYKPVLELLHKYLNLLLLTLCLSKYQVITVLEAILHQLC